MNIFAARKDTSVFSLSGQIASVLVLAVLFWATNVPLFFSTAKAAQLTLVKDTLTDSDLGVLTKHVIAWTTATSTIAGQTIKITLDPNTSRFTQVFSSATTTDITSTGFTITNTCSGAASEVTVQGNYNNGTDENLTLTVCAGDTIAAGAKTLTVGASTKLWTNPSIAGSYRILVGGTWDDSGETRVAIIDDVVVTASVNTSFTFTVSGVSTGTGVNGDTTSTTTTATAIAYGTLTPSTPVIAAQTLAVTTNASNGFVVTVVEDQHLTSATGADIDNFKDGADTATPTAWTSPLSTLGTEATYGHFGVTSEDSTLTAGDEFGSQLYAGNIAAAREVFMHTGPADGTTANQGSTKVGYKIEVGSLQEAGNDYTNSLTYVATPTF